MKIKRDYVLSQFVDEWIVVPLGGESDRLHGVLSLNETGAFLWNIVNEDDKTEEELVSALIGEYEVDLQTAKNDVRNFVDKLKELDCIG